MHALSAVIEIIKAIAELVRWLGEKSSGRPKIASQPGTGGEWEAPSSLLGMVLKPVEPLLRLFTNHGVIWLALLLVGGLMVKLPLDERIGMFFIGIIFALAGAGNLVATRKDPQDPSCIHALLYAISAFVLLFGVLVAMGALLLLIAGVPVHPSGV